ncbi:DUF2313 domain-containing protein [Bacillus cereus]|uniref:putative phage tail protein n=1 Tax=Paenibacillus melissococcoides TaxID=2912268 RepID=UPI002DCB7EBE|nr:DUF2313 domain-containing protein [Bacillus cereus]
MNKLMQHLPEFYYDILEFVELTDTETTELAIVQKAVERLFDDQFVLTASETALKRREQMLGIQADPTQESLDFRKKRIINRYSTKPPFTIRYLQERLDFLVGAGRAVVSVDPERFIITVTADIKDAPVFKEVDRTVKTTIPANLVYQQHTALEDVISLTEHIKMQSLFWNYKMDGTWQLGEKPFVIYGTEVPIK